MFSTKFTSWNESSHWLTQCSTAKGLGLAHCALPQNMVSLFYYCLCFSTYLTPKLQEVLYPKKTDKLYTSKCDHMLICSNLTVSTTSPPFCSSIQTAPLHFKGICEPCQTLIGLIQFENHHTRFGSGVDCAHTFFRQLFLYEKRGLEQAHALSCTALCQPMRWLISLSKLCTVQLRPHPYWESMHIEPTPSRSPGNTVKNQHLSLFQQRYLIL